MPNSLHENTSLKGPLTCAVNHTVRVTCGPVPRTELYWMRGICESVCSEISNRVDTAQFSPSAIHCSQGKYAGVLCTSHEHLVLQTPWTRSDPPSMGSVMFSCWLSPAFPHPCCRHCFSENRPKCFTPALAVLCNSNTTSVIRRFPCFP